LLVTLIGLFVGAALAFLGGWWLRDGIDLSDYAQGLNAMGISTNLAPVLRARDLGVPFIVGSFTALVSSWWPARRAVASRPAEALRHT